MCVNCSRRTEHCVATIGKNYRKIYATDVDGLTDEEDIRN